MLGSFSDRQDTSAHDPLAVRAILLDDGRTRIAITVCDNCALPRELLDQAKQLAAQRTGIPTERMLIAATHTHSAPAIGGNVTVHGLQERHHAEAQRPQRRSRMQ